MRGYIKERRKGFEPVVSLLRWLDRFHQPGLRLVRWRLILMGPTFGINLVYDELDDQRWRLGFTCEVFMHVVWNNSW